MKFVGSLLIVAVLVLAFSVEDTAAYWGYPVTYAYAYPAMPMGGMMGGMGMGGMMGGMGMGGMGYGGMGGMMGGMGGMMGGMGKKK
jgi:hypothetical protein